jgi:signal transduction histidine kinase/streptogramin lyase
MMPTRLRVLAAAFLLAGAGAAWSQKAASNWRIYRVPDGLPEPGCISVTLTMQGKVIVKHLNLPYLSELDGYTSSPLPAPPTGHGRVYQSPGGQLWTVAPDGLLEFRDGIWKEHYIPEIAEDLRNRAARAIDPVPLYPVRQGRVVLLLPDRLLEFSCEVPEKPRFRILRGVGQTGLGRFSNLSPARDGGLWISGLSGLAKVPGPVRSLKPETVWSEHIPPPSLRVRNFQEAREDTQGGVTTVADSTEGNLRVLLYFDGRNWTAEKAGSEKIRLGWRGPDATRWAATISSLYQLEPGLPELVENEEVSARQFFDLATEPGGAFWLATSDGLFRHAPLLWRSPRAVQHINAPVYCMTVDAEGRLWFLSGGALHLLQDETHREFPFPAGLARDLQNARGMSPLDGGGMLIEAGGRLLIFDPSTGFSAAAVPNPGRQYEILGALRNGAVCLQSHQPAAADSDYALELFDGTRLQPFPGSEAAEVLGGRFTSIYSAQNGDLWLSSDRGTASLKDGKWRVYSSENQVVPESVLGFVETPEGRVWCATRERLWEFDGRSWSMPKAGFDRINTFRRGRDGDLWVASNSGLHRFAQGPRLWVENGTEEGLPSAAIRAICEDPKGRIWVGTTRGLSLYRPEADSDPPQTLIQGTTNNVTVRENGTINLNFTGLDKWRHTPRERLLYSYRLDEKDWSPFSEVNTVSYSELGGGKHYFQVRAMDRNCNIDPDPVRLEFVVVLPWYKEIRLVVISLTGLAMVLFFAALAFNRHLQLLRSYAEVEKKVADRTRELEIANRRLSHSQKMTALGTLAAGVAHDFNNILSIIKGSAQLIEDNLDRPEKVRVRVDRIKTVVEQGAGIVKAMLGFSRDSEYQQGPCDLNAVVNDTVKLLGERFLREVDVVFEPTPGLPPTRASKDFIQQILLNLVFNAAESMSGRKRIVLATRFAKPPPSEVILAPAPAAGYVFVSVQDFGCGIPAENLQRIFEPFFTTKAMSAKRGTGLGLSMAYELAKKLEAGLAVESVVNQGSTFTLVLPVREDPRPESGGTQYEYSHYSHH